MKRILIVAAIAVTVLSIALGQKRGSGEAGREKGSVEGVIVKGNKATLKEGYKFVRKSSSTVAIARIRSGVVMGEALCSKCDGSGSCEPKIRDDSKVISCEGSCSRVCDLVVITKEPRPNAGQRVLH